MSDDSRLHDERRAEVWRLAWDSLDLVEVIAALYAQEINVGLQTFWDGGMEVWIGDDMNGRRRSETFAPGEFAQAVWWLKLTAEEVYPVLRRHRLGIDAYV